MIRIIIAKGDITYELTHYEGRNLVMKKTLEIHTSEYGSNYQPVINTASFEMLFAGAPAALMLEQDVTVTIVEDDEPLFTGYVRPLSSLDFRRTGVNDRITVECEGCMSRLTTKEHIGQTVDLGSALKVFTPNTPASSFVHLVLARMSWMRGISGPAIDRDVPIARLMDGDKLLDKIVHLLFCTGHYLTECPDGSLIIRPFVVEQPIPIKTYSIADANIIGDLSLTRDEPDNTAIALTYGRYKTIPEYAILTEDVQHAIYLRYSASLGIYLNGRPWVYPYNLSSDGTPPHIYGRSVTLMEYDWNARYATFRRKLDSDGNETNEEDVLFELPEPNVTGLTAGLWKYDNLRAEIILSDMCDIPLFGIGWHGSYKKSGTIKVKIASNGAVAYYRIIDDAETPLELDHPLQGCVKLAAWTVEGLNLKIGPMNYNDDPRKIFIEGITVYGVLRYIFSNPDATYDDDAPRIVVGNGARQKTSAEYCLQPADAEGIAKALYVQLDCPKLKLCSYDKVANGSIVAVKHEMRGIDITGRVISVNDAPETAGKRYTYVVEGLSNLTISSAYMPAIPSQLGYGRSSAQDVAELIAARARQAAIEANTQSTVDEIYANIFSLQQGGLYDGVITRAKLEAGFIDEHDTLLEELFPGGLDAPSSLDIQASDIATLQAEVYPLGPTKPSAPALISESVYTLDQITNILLQEITARDEGLVITDQRISAVISKIDGAVAQIASLELTVDDIQAIVAEFAGDHTRIAALELKADAIEASVADYDAQKAKVASLELNVDAIMSVLSELEVNGEIINLSLVIQNADRISQIVADGGYLDGNNVFHPTKAYTAVTQLANRYELFLAGDVSEKNLATWIATTEQIASFVTEAQVVGEIEGALAPVEAAVSSISQRADALELSVATADGKISTAALETKEALLAALDTLEAQTSSSVIITQGRIDLIVANQADANTQLWARLSLEADRITTEVARAIATETDLYSQITQQADRIDLIVASQADVDAQIWARIGLESSRITSEIARATNGEVVLASQIQQTVDAITQEISERSSDRQALTSLIQQEAARITQEVIDRANAISEVSSTITQTADSINTHIQSVVDDVLQNASAIEQKNDLIAALVDDALNNITSGLIITGNRIELIVSEQAAENASIWSQLDIEADRITTEVARATAAETTLHSQVAQQASQIAARVAARYYNEATQKWEDTAAFLALQVALPTIMTSTRRAAILALLNATEIDLFNRVYDESYEYNYGDSSTQIYYRISDNADDYDITRLKQVFQRYGLLSSQFVVDADEIIMDGTIRGRHLEMESVATDVFNALRARIQELSAKRLAVDTDTTSSNDFEAYIDENNGILVRNAGVVIFSINPTTGKVYIHGTADIEDGTFRGSIESGPLILNKGAPASSNFTIQGIIANFIIQVVSATGLNGATVACSGTYQGIEIEAVYLQAISSPKTYTYRQWGPAYYKAWCYYYDWMATTTAYDLTLKLYKKSDHSELFAYTEHYEPSCPWVRGELHGAEYDACKYTWDPEPSPNPKAKIGGTQTFGATGTLSFVASAFTCKLVNLPIGYSSDYAPGTIYRDQDGFLKVKT